MDATPPPLRIGILGAARIAPMALVRPARQVADARVYGIAAREPSRAGRFQVKHGLDKAYPSYQALLEDTAIEAIYNPLPNSLHCEWTIRALEAGKHVLCEKPLAANAAEAERMKEAAERTGQRLFEAFHYRYHPLFARMREIIDSGEIGDVRHFETRFCIPLPFFSDIRYRYDLAGGATMDTGCYAIHLLRHLAGAEPEVLAARAIMQSPEVDRRLEADLRFPDGRSGRVVCSLFSRTLLRADARVLGSAGEMRVLNPIAPHLYHRITVRSTQGQRSEKVDGEATYTHQLRAFVRHVREDAAIPTGPDDAVANMRVIDAIYEAAGLSKRGALS
jgi:predicted dehydrogenase